MASAPTSIRNAISSPMESPGSASFNADCRSLQPCSLLPVCAAPIFPFNSDEFFDLRSGPGDRLSTSFACTPQLSERHVFLCFKEPQFWPPELEAVESDRLPRFLAAAIELRKNQMAKKTRLIICEGRDGTESCNGDVMIFPDMVRYRGLTHFDVETFVEEVLVAEKDWLPGKPDRIFGTYIFVCAHRSREVQSGVIGPLIIKRLMDEISSNGLGTYVYLKPCSYIGGYKSAENLIVYGSAHTGDASGHCYAHVTPNNVCDVINDFINKGYLVERHERHVTRETGNVDVHTLPPGTIKTVHTGNGHAHAQCKPNLDHSEGGCTKSGRRTCDGADNRKRVCSSCKWWQASWWFNPWEKEDTLAVIAVLGATASVAITCQLLKRSRNGFNR